MLETENVFLVERTPFVSALKQYKTKYPNLFTQMNIENPTTEETDVIGLYEIIVFQKTQNHKRFS